MSKSMIIIGAGIAGLATGCYARMNGFQTRIFEQQGLPGGLCTGWKRKDYTFDGCLKWVIGTNPDFGLNQLWQELGVMHDLEFIDHAEFAKILSPGGRELHMYSDLSRLEGELVACSAPDRGLIHEFIRGTRRVARMNSGLEEKEGILPRLRAGLSLFPSIPTLRKFSQVTIGEFFGQIKDPFLRQAFLTENIHLPSSPVLLAMFTLAALHNRNAGYPLGGSLAFARALEKRYLALGGKIHYQTPVHKILVENGRAMGVLAGGDDQQNAGEHRADLVISAADGRTTLWNLLGEEYLDDEIVECYRSYPVFKPVVQVSLGVARDFSGEPSVLKFLLADPIHVGGVDLHELTLRHYCFDPSAAPRGKSALTISFYTDFDYWKTLENDPARLSAEKDAIVDKMIAELDRHYPGLHNRVEVVDVITPLATEKRTANQQGSVQGWMITPETIHFMLGASMRRAVKGLRNFAMVGQWVDPGGVANAALSGRKLVKLLCAREHRPFETTNR